MSNSLIELRSTNRTRGRVHVGIDFPCRVRIVSRTPKALSVEPLRKRRHGAYVPRLWFPRSLLAGPVSDDVSVCEVTMPMWLWERNARPEPEAPQGEAPQGVEAS